jgi:uncharacterized phage-associated protein
MGAANELAAWIRAEYAGTEPLTHLKLQKLVFYGYGACLAHGREGDLGGEIVFRPWKHGPVNHEVWSTYRAYAGKPIPPPDHDDPVPRYASDATTHLRDALVVYGALTAWNLRQESHLEAPWIRAFGQKEERIPHEELRTHFERKFRSGHVQFPEHLVHTSSFNLDRIPTLGFPTLHELAQALARVGRS